MTHVLLPDWLLPRRSYAAPVIWKVLVEHANGLGYRRIALRHRLPETTVRDWLRVLRAGHNRAAVMRVERHDTTMPAWRLAVRLTRGRLLANTNPPHLADLVFSGPSP